MTSSPRGLVFFDKGSNEIELLMESGVEVTVVHDHASDLQEMTQRGVRTMLLDELLVMKGTWDVAVLVAGFDRYLRTTSESGRRKLYEWLARRCTISLISAPRRALDSTLNLFGPYQLAEISDCFTFIGEITSPVALNDSPLLLASENWLCIGDTWHRSGDLRILKRSTSDGDLDTRAFCYLTSDGQIIKTELVNTDYFERCQTLSEALFLQRVNESTDLLPEFPQLLAFTHGCAVVTSARSAVSGDALEHGSALRQPKLCNSLVELARDYARAGLFHNDLRPWNVLWDGNITRFIDFADTSSRDRDTMGLPQIAALIGTILYLQGFPIRANEAFSDDVTQLLFGPREDDNHLPPSLFDGPWRSLALMDEPQLLTLADQPLLFWEQIAGQHGVSFSRSGTANE